MQVIRSAQEPVSQYPRLAEPGSGFEHAAVHSVAHLPSDIVAAITEKASPKKQMEILRDAVLSHATRSHAGRSHDGPARIATQAAPRIGIGAGPAGVEQWNRTIAGDVALVSAHPSIAQNIPPLIEKTSLASLIALSTKSPSSNAAVIRRNALTARCLWGSLAAPGRKLAERLVKLALIAPPNARAAEAMRAAADALLPEGDSALTDETRLALIRRLSTQAYSRARELQVCIRSDSAAQPSTPAEKALNVYYERTGELLLHILRGFAGAEQITGLAHATRYAVRHNLAAVQAEIVPMLARHLDNANDNSTVQQICKTLLTDRSFNEDDFERSRIGRDELRIKPHFHALLSRLYAHPALPSNLRILAAAADQSTALEAFRDSFTTVRELLAAAETTNRTRADFFEMLHHYNDAAIDAEYFPILLDHFHADTLPATLEERSHAARLANFILLHPASERIEADFVDADELILDELQERGNAFADALLQHPNVPSRDAASALRGMARYELWSLPRASVARSRNFTANVYNGAIHIAESAKNFSERGFFRDLRTLTGVYQRSVARELLPEPAEREKLDAAVCDMLATTLDPARFRRIQIARSSVDAHLLDLAEAYWRNVSPHSQPLPLSFAESLVRSTVARTNQAESPRSSGDELRALYQRLYDTRRTSNGRAQAVFAMRAIGVLSATREQHATVSRSTE